MLNILQSKCKVMKKTPVATALYACNFATAADDDGWWETRK